MDPLSRRRFDGEVKSARGAIPLRRGAEVFLVAVAYAALAVFLLQPWFSDPTRTVAAAKIGAGGVIETADVNLVMWILAWDWHALTTDPRGLFDANIFHPAPRTLAGSEHLLGHVPIFGPVYEISGNPVLAYQILFLANLALSGAALHALLRHWGMPASAAFFGGLLYVFFPFRMFFANYVHLSAGQYAPLALLFLDRTLLFGRTRDAAVLCVALLAQMLCSYYLAYFMLIALAGYLAGVLWGSRGRLRLRGCLLSTAAAVVAASVFAALSLPYIELRTAGSIPTETEMHFLKRFSVGPWWEFFERQNMLYLGIAPLLLAIVGTFLPRTMHERVPWARPAAIGLALACYTMALGPEREIAGRTITFPYSIVMDIVPGFSSMRGPLRFLMIAQLGFAALSSMGLTWLLRSVDRRRGTLAAFACAVVLTLATVWDYGLLFEHRETRVVEAGAVVPEVYRKLASLPPGPVLEIPSSGYFGYFRGAIVASEYMLHSTAHWLPLLDGYSGYAPPSAAVTSGLISALPHLNALTALVRTTGLRYIVVHRDALAEEDLPAWSQPPGLQQLGEFDSAVLFEVGMPLKADLVDQLIDFEPRSETLLGVPLVPLLEDERHASIQTDAESKIAIGGSPIGLKIAIVNHSEASWPALASVGEHLVTVGYRWLNMHDKVVAEVTDVSRLAYDLDPGKSLRQRIVPLAPGRGKFRLVIGLVQDGEWFPATAAPIPVLVRPITGLAGLNREGAAEFLGLLQEKAAERQ